VISLSALAAACGGQQAAAPAPAAASATPAPSSAPAPAQASAAPAPASAPAPSLADREKKAVSDWFAAFNAHDVKALAALYASDAVLASPGPGGWSEKKGRDTIAPEFAVPFAAMPDLKAAPVRIFQKNDVVVIEWAASGTNTGEFMGPPTNKKAAVWGASVLWFNADGLITRDEEFHDQATILQQLGKMPGKARDLATLPSGDATLVAAAGTPDEDKLVDQMKATWPATWNKRDPKAYGEVITEDMVHSEIASPNDYKGKEAGVKECAMYAKALPDMTATIDKAWAFAPNIVIAEFTFTGTMKGAIGPFKPTNKPITIHGLDVDEMKDGKLQKAVTYSNGMELLSALGVLPKPGAPAKGAADAKAGKK
jgi:steroid delta-isomerase-like uncharacterized protein